MVQLFYYPNSYKFDYISHPTYYYHYSYLYERTFKSILSNDYEEVRYVLKNNSIDKNVKLDDIKYSLLHICQDAIMSGILLDYGVKESFDVDGNSALHCASSKSQTNVLLLAGFDPNKVNKYRRTPLHYAHSYEQSKVLLENGANKSLFVIDENGHYPIDYALTSEEQFALLLTEMQKNKEEYSAFLIHIIHKYISLDQYFVDISYMRRRSWNFRYKTLDIEYDKKFLANNLRNIIGDMFKSDLTDISELVQAPSKKLVLTVSADSIEFKVNEGIELSDDMIKLTNMFLETLRTKLFNKA